MSGQCVILAGGLGTRMWPEAQTVPKTLLPVAGKPFAAWQLQWLAEAGIDEVIYCIGYLHEMVSDFVGDGVQWGLKVRYVIEDGELRGTAGALRLALDSGVLADDFLILYGDSWLQVNPGEVLERLRAASEPAVMTVFRNEGRFDGSNVVYADGLVQRYEKGLAEPPPEMCWIDYGLLGFAREVVEQRVPAGETTDLAPLCTQLAAERQLAGFPVVDRFFEIGSPQGRADTERLLLDRSGSAHP